jgi:hypothetical protein
MHFACQASDIAERAIGLRNPCAPGLYRDFQG